MKLKSPALLVLRVRRSGWWRASCGRVRRAFFCIRWRRGTRTERAQL